MLDPVREFPEYTVVMTTLWPNLIIQQQSNTLATRQLITRVRRSSSSRGPSSAMRTTTRR